MWGVCVCVCVWARKSTYHDSRRPMLTFPILPHLDTTFWRHSWFQAGILPWWQAWFDPWFSCILAMDMLWILAALMRSFSLSQGLYLFTLQLPEAMGQKWGDKARWHWTHSELERPGDVSLLDQKHKQWERWQRWYLQRWLRAGHQLSDHSWGEGLTYSSLNLWSSQVVQDRRLEWVLSAQTISTCLLSHIHVAASRHDVTG